ncbi:MAG: alpha/beta fold hydrolase [Blastocatellia bacterium]
MKKIQIQSSDGPLEICCRDEGNGSPLVFLHAFPLSQRMWDGQLAALAERFRVMTFDWRGFGDSELRGDVFTMEQFADDLRALLDALELDRVTLCGLSMGGYAAFAFMRKYAARVANLILADTRAGEDLAAARQGRLDMARRALTEGAGVIADLMIPRLLAPATIRNHPEINARLRAIIEANDPRAIAAAQAGMAARADATALLEQIRCPALIIVGGEDALTPPSEAKKMFDRLPGAQMAVINGVGHLPNLEAPAEFNRIVTGFLTPEPF